jgi:hypothetical protein
MKLTLNVAILLSLSLLSLTVDGTLVINCASLFLIEATFNKQPLLKKLKEKELFIPLPKNIQHLAIPDMAEYLATLKVVVDPEHSRDKRVKAMAGLTPTCAPVPSPARHTPVVSQNGNGTITGTVCVSSSAQERLSTLTPVPPTKMGNACCGVITFNPADVIDKGEGYYDLKLEDGSILQFKLHNEVKKEVRALLEKAWDAADCAEGRRRIKLIKQKGLDAAQRDSRQGANAGVSCIEAEAHTTVKIFSAFDGRWVASPDPMFGLGVSSRDWAYDAEGTNPPPVPTPAHVLPRNEVATATSGLKITLSARDQRAQRKKEESERKKQEEAKRGEEELLVATARIAELQTVPVQEEEAQQPSDPIYVKNKISEPLDAMVALAESLGIHLGGVVHSGPVLLLDVSPLLANGFLSVGVSARGNELICGVMTDDDTFKYGCISNVDPTSYPALLAMFPEKAETLEQVVQSRHANKIAKPSPHAGLLPVPSCLQYCPYQAMDAFPVPVPCGPVFDEWGQFVGWRVVPLA